MDWQHVRDFLHGLGVEMEESEIPEAPTHPNEPRFTLLQRSRDHEALYRVDLIDTQPELLVLLPTHDNPLRFHFYLVQPSATHPLVGSLDRVAANQLGREREQMDEVVEWYILQAFVETMKVAFWAGLETAQFPHEIVVYKLL